MLDDDDLPVLNAVVRGGDAAIIRAVRLGAEPAVATPHPLPGRRLFADASHAPIDIDASRDAAGNRASRRLADVRVTSPDDIRAPDRVERRIDAIVERHVEALRRDVRDVLERSLGDADA